MSYLPIIELNTVDSTNNYAMRLIDADTARHGTTIVTQTQTAGKGQRGKTWADVPGESLLMTVLTAPGRPITDQFVFNANIAVAIANVLQKLDDSWRLSIKWPNDIIINDKKAGGILIENILRGSRWNYSVIGLGLNILQREFRAELPYATSLRTASGREFDVTAIRDKIRESIIHAAGNPLQVMNMNEYNDYLYKKNELQKFSDATGSWEALILGARPDGMLDVRLGDGSVTAYQHGQVLWDWE